MTRTYPILFLFGAGDASALFFGKGNLRGVITVALIGIVFVANFVDFL